MSFSPNITCMSCGRPGPKSTLPCWRPVSCASYIIKLLPRCAWGHSMRFGHALRGPRGCCPGVKIRPRTLGATKCLNPKSHGTDLVPQLRLSHDHSRRWRTTTRAGGGKTRSGAARLHNAPLGQKPGAPRVFNLLSVPLVLCLVQFVPRDVFFFLFFSSASQRARPPIARPLFLRAGRTWSRARSCSWYSE